MLNYSVAELRINTKTKIINGINYLHQLLKTVEYEHE